MIVRNSKFMSEEELDEILELAMRETNIDPESIKSDKLFDDLVHFMNDLNAQLDMHLIAMSVRKSKKDINTVKDGLKRHIITTNVLFNLYRNFYRVSNKLRDNIHLKLVIAESKKQDMFKDDDFVKDNH